MNCNESNETLPTAELIANADWSSNLLLHGVSFKRNRMRMPSFLQPQPIHKENFTARHPLHRVPHSKEAGDGSRPAAKGHHCPHATSPQVATNLWDPGDRGSIIKVANRTCTCTAASFLARGARAPVWGAIRGLACPRAVGQLPRFN